MTQTIQNQELINRLIVGRVLPHIYAFKTNTVPNFLKVGDTFRPVETRLQEWRRYFPELKKQFEGKATVTDDIYFRDFAVHRFLEKDLSKLRLTRDQISQETYYSREFFGDTTAKDIEDAIENIKHNYETNTSSYDYYDAAVRLPTQHQYLRGENWLPRPNQKSAIEQFVKAVGEGRTNLLMYAVMRFGKSFTSLCCAKEIGSKTTLVLSAKADVKDEWKKTVELAGNFESFVFLDSDSLLRNADAIKDEHEKGQSVVVFLTLQDLQGPHLKDKHKEVFRNEINLLIVDETHFGARAEEYGRVLKNAGQASDDRGAMRRGSDDHVETNDADQDIKELNAQVRLHLSGTPYRILMGSEFTKEDIIAFVQFSDVVQEQEAWDRENLGRDDVNEWDNPYFGFPQMIRFAFNPNQSSMKKMETLRTQGVSFAFSALLEPKSIKQDKQTNLHKQFKHEAEILDLLHVIDGSKQDDGILGFLDYDRIKAGKMCRHMVMVLPYCASCDAMQKLIETHRDKFKNLGDYKIINISGVEGAKHYKNPEQVKQVIAEAADEKTLTLTVNRMLTGSTVEQWDTMLFLKDTSSPQEYDQAIFRLQNQYVRVLNDASGSKVIKDNLKPQTLLVDFDPMRLFQMQEQKSLIYNANTDDNGNAKLKDRLEEELRISPIITVNHSKINQVEAANILDAVSEYNSQRSIADEAREVPVDLGLLASADILRVIEAQAELGSRAGLTINPVEGDGEDLDVEESEGHEDTGKNTGSDDHGLAPSVDAEDTQSLAKKLQTYYQRILFFAMLTRDHVRSLSGIVDVIGHGQNQRIACNLGLDANVLREIHSAFDPFKLSSLDYKIQNISMLARDESLTPIERANRALNKFTRISNSEVRTPSWLCRDMIAQIPGHELMQAIERGEVLLDVASKSGEFALAIYDRLTNELGVDPAIAKTRIYSVPTSSIAYEFTRFFYDILGLEVKNIACEFTSYDLVTSSSLSGRDISDIVKDAHQYGEASAETGGVKGKPLEGERKLKFGAIVGNPPYQVSDGGAQASARPIYQDFILLAEELNPQFMTFVVPTRWYLGGKGLEKFRERMLSDPHIRELHDYLAPEVVFPGTNNRGGICYFIRDQDYDASKNMGTRIITHDESAIISDTTRPLNTFGSGVFLRNSAGVEIVQKVITSENFEAFSQHVSPRKPFGLDGNIVNAPEFHKSPTGVDDPVPCFGKAKKLGYVSKKIVRSHRDWIDDWKVFTPYANNIGTELNDDNQNAFIGAPGSVCSETFLIMGIGLELNEGSAINLIAYLKTKFARFLHAQAKISQHGTKMTYRFLPTIDLTSESPINWESNTDAIDEQLFSMFNLNAKERDHIRISTKCM